MKKSPKKRRSTRTRGQSAQKTQAAMLKRALKQPGVKDAMDAFSRYEKVAGVNSLVFPMSFEISHTSSDSSFAY